MLHEVIDAERLYPGVYGKINKDERRTQWLVEVVDQLMSIEIPGHVPSYEPGCSSCFFIQYVAARDTSFERLYQLITLHTLLKLLLLPIMEVYLLVLALLVNFGVWVTQL